MLGTSSVPGWTALAAVAGILQFFALVVTARFVWRYLKETEELRKAAQRQLAASEDQLEAQIRPAIVVQVRPAGGIALVNLGKGPALELMVLELRRGSDAFDTRLQHKSLNEFVADRSFLEEGGERRTGIYTQPVFGVVNALSLNGHGLQCRYRSLSGRSYRTVVEFDFPATSTVISTRVFKEKDDLR